MSQPRPRGLGRGLDALIPMSSQGEALVPQMIAVDQIRPSRQQVRSRFDSEPLGELAESIRLHGVLQPLLVRPLADGYELIAGERRWRAARLAGLEAVPAVVRGDAGNDQQLVLGLIENLQRTDLDPIEEARGLRRLIEEFGLTHDETAQRLGKHRVSVTQSLRLLGGCPAVQSAVAAGVITAGHARALIALEGQAVQAQSRDRQAPFSQADRELGADIPAPAPPAWRHLCGAARDCGRCRVEPGRADQADRKPQPRQAGATLFESRRARTGLR